MIKNYLSKIGLAYEMSRNSKTFFNLLRDTKKYTSKVKSKTLNMDDPSTQIYQLQKNNHPFDAEIRTYKGDFTVFYEIFWKEVYKIPAAYKIEPKTIIDLGGHVGFTSMYFALNYPNALIISLEASKANYAVLSKNISSFPSIKALNKAVYFEDGSIRFDESGASFNTKIGESGDEIEAISIPTLMKNFGLEKIDLIKIDIEGAEIELLNRNNEWLHLTQAILIEIHKPYTIQELKSDLEPFGFEVIEPNESNGFKNIFARKSS